MFALLSLALAAPGYLRGPDIHGDLVVFSAEGDLWTAPASGGSARRLVSREADEFSAHFSPDGKTVAFSATYGGNMDIYTVPTEGGTPKRLTWGPDGEDCVGWTPDGKEVIFRSRSTDPNGTFRLYTVPAAGGDSREMPLGWAARVDIDPQSGQWAFTRLGRESATWKRYRGGSADDIWVGDPKKADYKQITSHEGPDSFPMWNGGRIYFLSDRGGTANLWSMKPDGSDRVQHTQHSDWDARWPSMGPDGRIVYMLAGDIYVYNPADKTDKKIAIDLPGEGGMARVRYPDPLSYLTAFSLSPDADRVLVTTRGELFSVPTEDGVTLSLSSTSGARESWGSYAPDGTRIAYVTDASGEESIVTADAWGRGKIQVVKPAGSRGWHMPMVWSGDGKWLAYADELHKLYVVPVAGGTPKEVDSSSMAEITEYVWSADGRYLAYAKAEENDYSAVYVYDTTDGKSRKVSTGSTSDQSPAWDPDGRYLYFLSSRSVNPVLSERDFQTVLLHGDVPVALLLRPDVPNPLAANAGLPPVESNPAVQSAAEEAKKKKKKKDKKEKEKDADPSDIPSPGFSITWEGLAQRLVVLPVAPGAYANLSATSSRLFFLGLPDGNLAGGGGSTTLWAYDLEGKETSVYLGDVAAYDLVPKAEKLAILQPGGLYVMPTAAPAGPESWEKSRVKLENISLEIEPRQEWRQIYLEAWRLQRDFFWDPAMGGLDWLKLRDQYGTLLDRLGSRNDLNDLIGELIGELGTSHTYVCCGDTANWEAGPGSVGMLGASFQREGNALKITRIYRGDQADNEVSPLLEPGLGVSEGEYLLAVNNRPIQPDLPLEALMQGLAGKRVVLTISPRPTLEGSRQVVVTPLAEESGLRHADWVRKNREYVNEKSKGKLGYIHIPDMGAAGLVAFETWFYPQSNRDGLVIDVRWNRGGFVSQLILEKLRRPIDGWVVPRHGSPSPYPYARRSGPLVVITNEFAGSDGDIFPKAMQVEGLAPVIGMRSWGGVIGIRADKPAVDSGFLSQPEYAFFFRTGGWQVENRGVIPDIEVPWLPQDVVAGVDPQLDRAIAEALSRIDQAAPRPALDPRPKKTREEFRRQEP
jgi:tricorn protease